MIFVFTWDRNNFKSTIYIIKYFTWCCWVRSPGWVAEIYADLRWI